jgi:hypothetical protein
MFQGQFSLNADLKLLLAHKTKQQTFEKQKYGNKYNNTDVDFPQLHHIPINSISIQFRSISIFKSNINCKNYR